MLGSQDRTEGLGPTVLQWNMIVLNKSNKALLRNNKNEKAKISTLVFLSYEIPSKVPSD